MRHLSSARCKPTVSALGSWEPNCDTERWKQAGILSLFVQRTGQGDGEMLEAVLPPPVSILDWQPASCAK